MYNDLMNKLGKTLFAAICASLASTSTGTGKENYVLARTKDGIDIMSPYAVGPLFKLSPEFIYCGIVRELLPGNKLSVAPAFMSAEGTKVFYPLELIGSAHPDAATAKADLDKVISAVKKDPNLIFKFPYYDGLLKECRPTAHILQGRKLQVG